MRLLRSDVNDFLEEMQKNAGTGNPDERGFLFGFRDTEHVVLTADDEHVAGDGGSGDHDLADFVSRKQFKSRACLDDKHVSIFAGEVDFSIGCYG
jgi:hypothetical protein